MDIILAQLIFSHPGRPYESRSADIKHISEEKYNKKKNSRHN